MKNRNYVIDIGKVIAAMMVIAIHTGLFSDVDDTVYFFVVHVLCRTAVPFFTVCSGYFMGKQYWGHPKKGTIFKHSLFLRQWKKIVVLYLVWTGIYLLYSIPNWVRSGWFSPWAFVDYAVAVCTQGSYYHLWYLWGLIFVLPVFFLVLKYIPMKIFPSVIGVLWLFKIVGYAYGVFLPAFLRPIAGAMGKFETMLCLLPLLLLGAWISQEKKRGSRFCAGGLGISFLGLAFEAFALRCMGQEAVSYIAFTLPTAYFLFHCVLCVKMEQPGMFLAAISETSLFTYCAHPVFVGIFSEFVHNSVLLFALCAVCSLGIGCGYAKLCKKRKRNVVALS